MLVLQVTLVSLGVFGSNIVVRFPGSPKRQTLGYTRGEKLHMSKQVPNCQIKQQDKPFCVILDSS